MSAALGVAARGLASAAAPSVPALPLTLMLPVVFMARSLGRTCTHAVLPARAWPAPCAGRRVKKRAGAPLRPRAAFASPPAVLSTNPCQVGPAGRSVGSTFLVTEGLFSLAPRVCSTTPAFSCVCPPCLSYHLAFPRVVALSSCALARTERTASNQRVCRLITASHPTTTKGNNLIFPGEGHC